MTQRWLIATAAVLLVSRVACADAVVSFEVGPEGWVGPAGPGGVTVIDATGGNPDGNMHATFQDFGISFRNSSNADFIGDYTRFATLTLQVDVRVQSIDFFGTPVSRPWVVELRDFDAPPPGYPYVSVWYELAEVSEATHGSWTTLSVTIDDPLATGLPSGWGGTGAEDPMTFEPVLPAGRSFTDVLAGVDEIAYTTFKPGWVYGETAFDLRIDNAALLGGSAPLGEVPTLWVRKSEAVPGDVVVTWLETCGAGALDYALFEGSIGTWDGHAPLECNAGIDLIEEVTPGAGDRYYLVVPTDAEQEGSFGVNSSAVLRPQGTAPCLPAWDPSPCPPEPPACLPLPLPGGDGKIEIIRDYIESRYLPPMAGIAIVDQGTLVATAGLGGADGETMFWIASTSKFVTSVGAVALMAEGSLNPDAPVLSYVPDYTEANGREAEILIEHLLQNRSGLPQDGGCAGFACRQDLPGDATTTQYDLMVPDRGATLGNIFTPAMLARVPYSVFNETSFVPGSDYQYAGWGWMLAARAMELASGESFDALLQDRVLDKAGMCRATYDGSTVDANAALGTGTNAIDGFCLEPMLAPGHQGEGEPYFHDELDCAARMPQGGLHASAHDMGRLAEAVLRDLSGAGRITDAAAMRLLFCPDGGSGLPGAPGATCLGRAQVTGPQATQFGADYGFGNFRRTYSYGGSAYELYNHGGGRAGFGSYFALVPEAGLGISVLINRGDSADWHDVAECAIRVYLHGASSCF